MGKTTLYLTHQGLHKCQPLLIDHFFQIVLTEYW